MTDPFLPVPPAFVFYLSLLLSPPFMRLKFYTHIALRKWVSQGRKLQGRVSLLAAVLKACALKGRDRTRGMSHPTQLEKTFWLGSANSTVGNNWEYISATSAVNEEFLKIQLNCRKIKTVILT